jgi:hypothetical protein
MVFKSIIGTIYNRIFWKEIDETERTIVDLTDKISLLTTDNERLRVRKKLEEPVTTGTITIFEINDLLKEHASEILISDKVLNLTSMEEAQKFTEGTHVQYQAYVLENHDCDNYSFALMGYWSEGLLSYTLGIAWSKTHAFNILIDANKHIWVIEPQSNKYMTLEEAKKDKKYYPFKLVLM